MDSVVKVTGKDRHVFFIMRHDPETDVETYFEGFFNEVEGLGTENESMFYEHEAWCDLPDGAQAFTSFRDASDWLNVLDEKHRAQCSIGLFGWCDSVGVDGNHWFPLKWFASNGFE